MKLADIIGAEQPNFAEPWQAQAFAMTVALHEQGAFGWEEWAAALSDRIATDPEDDGSRYWTHWLDALQALMAERGIADPHAVAAREREWHRAAARTPHGEPIVLVHE